MAKQINMDVRRNPDATAPVLEFMLPDSELGMDLKEGERGTLIIPVGVVAVNDGMITFRKMDSITSKGGFHSETANEMRDRLIKDEKIEETEE